MRSNEKKKDRPANVAGESASERGFTLIEVSIAMVLLLVAALGVASLFTHSITYNSGGNDRAAAISIGQQQMEQLESVSFFDPMLDVSAATVLTPDTVNNGRTYRVTRTVTGSNNNTGGVPTLKTITIKVEPISKGWAGFPVILRTIRCSPSTGAY